MWMVFSAGGVLDTFNLIKATITLKKPVALVKEPRQNKDRTKAEESDEARAGSMTDQPSYLSH